MNDWTIRGSKASQTATPEGQTVGEPEIEGVVVRDVSHVPTANGFLTELLRTDWMPQSNRAIEHVFQQTFDPGTVSAWHAHADTTDRMFCVSGRMLVALYDGRKNSPTEGKLATYRVGTIRPALIVIPPGVWHGVKNIGAEPAILINMCDHPYRHADPDHWREPQDSPRFPFKF